MKTKAHALFLFAACAFLWPDSYSQTKGNDFPRLPGAELLMGYPPFSLAITTPTNTWILQDKEGDYGVTPSISRDGRVVASARVTAYNPVKLVISTYSVPEEKWRGYTELKYGADLAISPDGSKLAFDAEETEEGVGNRMHLHFIDLKTGIESAGPVIGRYGTIGISWSPDGSRIAYGMNQSLPTEGPAHSPAIEILEVATGRTWKVANGQTPAWSPSGDWIAYLNDSNWPNQIWVVHPDGAGSRLLVTLPRGRFGGERMFHGSEPPVWSPDSTKLLLNELYDPDRWTFNIHLLDLATLKLARKFKNKAPIFGWAEAGNEQPAAAAK